MSKSNLRIAILVLGLATALVHLYLNIRSGRFDFAFTANGLIYLALLFAFFQPIKLSFLAGREKLIHYVFMGFAAITIVAYFIVSDQRFTDGLGLTTKVIEVLLIVALWMHLQQSGK